MEIDDLKSIVICDLQWILDALEHVTNETDEGQVEFIKAFVLANIQKIQKY